MSETKSKSESTPEPEPKREPRALSNEYHKARKQLMLWAGILFIWELVGIDLEKVKEAGGNPGAIVGALKSPQAVPWALVILIVYFAFKLRTEWRQCVETRRKVREAKQDYYSAFIVAGVACALYSGQAISHIQFANFVQSSDKFASVTTGMMIGSGLALAISWYPPWRASGKTIGGGLQVYFALALVFGLPTVLVLRTIFLSKWLAMVGVALGAAAIVTQNLLMNRRGERRRKEMMQ